MLPCFRLSSKLKALLPRRPVLAPPLSTTSAIKYHFTDSIMSNPDSSGHVAKKQKRFHKKSKREKGEGQGTTEEVLLADVRDLLLAQDPQDGPPATRPERFTEIDVEIRMISSTGDGLGFGPSTDYVYAVPFTSAGDKVRAKVVTHFEDQKYALTDFIKVLKPGPLRQESLVKCPYFSRCSGCQFQMLSYTDQLAHKKSVVERAYRHFSNLTPEAVPPVQDTMASPLQYGYRTKLTPHFDGPRNARRDKRAGNKPTFTEVPPIGFMLKNTRKTLDIEDCPIGTDAVRAGMKSERQRVNQDIGNYTKGATLLLRESTKRVLKDAEGQPVVVRSETDGHTQAPDDQTVQAPGDVPGEPLVDSASIASFEDQKMCITDNNATSTEYIRDHVFVNPAGAFFQNNNSILPDFTDYVRSLILSPSEDPSAPPVTHLIDAYCGSGLFTIALSSLGLVSTGIDIATSSIECAQKNASLNRLPSERTRFRAADAAAIFEDVSSPPDQTVVIIDPPRKGCDNQFLSQLLAFGPKRLVYVSCNVHTQARDVAVLVEGKGSGSSDEPRKRYKLKTLRGLDFFPQTGHVESVALLEKEEGGQVSGRTTR